VLLPRAVVPEPRYPGTIWGAGDSPELPVSVSVMPAPTPAPAEVPEVSTPLAPTDKLAFPATVSFMLSPARGFFPLTAPAAAADDCSSSGTGNSFSLGSIIYVLSPSVGRHLRRFPYVEFRQNRTSYLNIFSICFPQNCCPVRCLAYSYAKVSTPCLVLEKYTGALSIWCKFCYPMDVPPAFVL
jgi:hypothetical protein